MKKFILILISFTLSYVTTAQVVIGGSLGATHKGNLTHEAQIGCILPESNFILKAGYIDRSVHVKVGLHYPLGNMYECDYDRRWYISPTFGLGLFKTIENKEQVKIPMGVGGVELGKKIHNYIAPYISVNYQNKMVIGLIGVKFFSR